MPSPTNHYNWYDFLEHLRQAGLDAEAKELNRLDAALRQAAKARSDAAQRILKANLAKLEPLLRPCHRRCVNELTVYTGTWV